jgi:glucose-6-phosphate 1-dehydrogenase
MAPTIFVLFGASGDLARRMVLPAFAALATDGLLPEKWVLIGNGRKDRDDTWFADHVREVLDDDAQFDAVSDHLMFAGNGFSVDDPGDLPDTIARARQQLGDDADDPALLVHYLALPPREFEPYVQALDAHGLATGWRVVFEKPYGTSPSSFRHLEQVVHGVFDEDQVYRLDHFLGKEATQNLHVLRFANRIVGDIWCNQGVEQVQIDVPETLGIDDRGAFYDATGATLDMVVTHLFQVAAEIAMEPPASLAGGHLLAARESVIADFRPLDPEEVVLGQYDGYRDVEGVADDSDTDTFIAARMWVDTDRWPRRAVPAAHGQAARRVRAARDARAHAAARWPDRRCAGHGHQPVAEGLREAGDRGGHQATRPRDRARHGVGAAPPVARRRPRPPRVRHLDPRRPRRRPLAVHLQ